jgi:intracellular sulfur oxidation DsrE/DsrF family protein
MILSARRRRFVLTLLVTVGVAGTAAASRPADRADAEATAAAAALAGDTGWVNRLRGEHRQLFDAPKSDNGIPLIHVLNYYNTYNSAFGVRDERINGVLTFYGMTVFHGLSDAMWAKYKIGEFVKESDASGRAAVSNPWRTSPLVLGMSVPDASIESLQKRGGTFILCNNALSIISGMLAKERGLDPKAVYADMRANVLPGVTVVPAMVIAIEQAQRAGVSYHRQ